MAAPSTPLRSALTPRIVSAFSPNRGSSRPGVLRVKRQRPLRMTRDDFGLVELEPARAPSVRRAYGSWQACLRRRRSEGPLPTPEGPKWHSIDRQRSASPFPRRPAFPVLARVHSRSLVHATRARRPPRRPFRTGRSADFYGATQVALSWLRNLVHPVLYQNATDPKHERSDADSDMDALGNFRAAPRFATEPFGAIHRITVSLRQACVRTRA